MDHARLRKVEEYVAETVAGYGRKYIRDRALEQTIPKNAVQSFEDHEARNVRVNVLPGIVPDCVAAEFDLYSDYAFAEPLRRLAFATDCDLSAVLIRLEEQARQLHSLRPTEDF